MKHRFKKINLTKKRLVGLVLSFFLINFWLLVSPARAGIFDGFFIGFFQGLFGWIIGLEGWIIATLTQILLTLMNYNGFVSAYAVQVGWTLVRDVTNLFFVVVLLAIAIGTILKVESYNFKRLLPKLLLMAILVNFSRLICGLIIDFAQVIMMTFAVAFQQVIAPVNSADSIKGSGSNLIRMLNIDKILQGRATMSGVSDETDDAVTIGNVIMTGMLAIILLLVAAAVILVMLVVIVMRIVMLWLLVVLSPFPFILSAFPQGQRYAQQWWQEFSKYVIIGPVLAFFLWLSFATANNTSGSNQGTIDLGDPNIKSQLSQENLEASSDALTPEQKAEANTQIFTSIGGADAMLSMILGIGMLLGSLMLTQQMGVAGGQFAGSMMGRLKQLGTGALKMPVKLASWADRKVYAGEVPSLLKKLPVLGGLFSGGVSFNPVRWYQQYSQYAEHRKQQQLSLGAGLAGAKFAAAWEPEKKGIAGMAGRVGNLARLALGDPADFMEAYGGVRFGTHFRELLTKKRAHPTHNLKRLETELAAGQRADESDADWNNRRAGLESGIEKEKTAVAPLPYYAAMEWQGVIKEELSKLPEAMDWGEIEGELDLAIAAKNVPRTFALMTKATKDYNDNEVWNRYGYASKLYGGKITDPEKGGMRQFFEDVIEKQLGVPTQMSRSFANYLAYMNEDLNHGGCARVIKVNNGIYEWANRKEQGTSISTERFKGSPRPKLQQAARLDTGGHEPDGEYNIGYEGFLEMAAWGPDIVNIMQRTEMNKSTLSNWLSDYVSMAYADILTQEDHPKRPGQKLIDPLVLQALRDPSSLKPDSAKSILPTSGASHQELVEWVDFAEAAILKKLATGWRPVKPAPAAGGQAGGPPPAPAGQPAPIPAGPRPTPRAAMAFDQGKHDLTHQQVQEYDAAGFDFFKTYEYETNKDKYEAKFDYQRHHAALNQPELDKIRGVRTASTVKSGALQAGVGLNFNNEEVKRALGVNEKQDAVYYEGPDKDKAVAAIVTAYQQQLISEGKDEKTIQEEREKLRTGLMNAETLRVHNNASLTSRFDQYRHEKAHAQTKDVTSQQLDDFWNSLSAKQQKAISSDISSRYGNISDLHMKKEALAEMVGVGGGNYQVSDKTKGVLNNLGIKTRSQAVQSQIDTVSVAGAGLRAKGSMVKTAGAQLGAGVVSLGKAAEDQAIQLAKGLKDVAAFLSVKPAKATINRVKTTFNGIKGYIKNERTIKAVDNLTRATEFYVDAKATREDVEKTTGAELIEKKKAKAEFIRENKGQYDRHLSERDKAIKSGDSAGAKKHAELANVYASQINKMDREINELQQEIDQARYMEGEAMSDVVRARRLIDKRTGRNKPTPKTPTEPSKPVQRENEPPSTVKPDGARMAPASQTPVSQPVRQKVEKVVEASRSGNKAAQATVVEEIIRESKPTAVVEASKNIIEEEVEKVDQALKSGSAAEIQSSLKNMTNAIDSITSVLGGFGDKLKGSNQISQLQSHATTAKNLSQQADMGSSLNSGSVRGVLSDIKGILSRMLTEQMRSGNKGVGRGELRPSDKGTIDRLGEVANRRNRNET